MAQVKGLHQRDTSEDSPLNVQSQVLSNGTSVIIDAVSLNYHTYDRGIFWYKRNGSGLAKNVLPLE